MNWAQRKVDVAAEGQRYALGRTTEFDGIWRKRPWGWRLVSRYPRTEEGWRVASAQFSDWEPYAQVEGSRILFRDEAPSPRRRRLIWGWSLIAIVAAVTAAGGVVLSRNGWSLSPAGSAATGGRPTAQVVGPGHLATGPDFIDYIQWHDLGGRLTGSAHVVTLTGHAPDLNTATRTLAVSGTLNASTISLSFDGSPAAFGALSGGSFTVDFPQPGSALAPVTFVSASALQYARAVAALGDQMAQANQVAASARTLKTEQHAITSDATAVASDIKRLSDLSSLTAAVESVGTSVQQVTTDLTQVQADLDKVLAEAPQGNKSQICSDASHVVASAAQKLAYDTAQKLEYDATQGVENQVGVLRGNVTSLQSDFAQLQSDQSVLPGYRPPNQPGRRVVTQTLAGTNNALTSAVTTTNGDIDQANTIVATAYGYLAEAFQVGSCGSPPATPDPQQDIE